MRIAMLSEGNAESLDGAFSGTAKGIVDQLRAYGHEVATVDCELYGWRRYALAMRTFHPNRGTWKAMFHFGPAAWRARSQRANSCIRRAGRSDLLLQIGGTFNPPAIGVPYALYCDWNMALTIDESASRSWAAHHLSTGQAQRSNARESAIYQGARAIFTISERLRQSFIEKYGVPAHRVHTAYAGPNIDIDAIPPRLALPSDHVPTVLFVGKQFERKGGDILISAFREVRRQLPTARLLMVGPVGMKIDEAGVEMLGSLRKSNPAENRRLLHSYESADVFCLPSRYDPFPTVVREAMFYRLPCVTSDIWAMPEMVIDGVTGFTVPAGDAATLAKRLLRLLQDPLLARQMGDAGRRVAEERFSWPAVGRRLNDHLLHLGSPEY